MNGWLKLFLVATSVGLVLSIHGEVFCQDVLPVDPGVQQPVTQQPTATPTTNLTTELPQGEEVELTRDFEDLRNQGFIGSTAEIVSSSGFVGAATEQSGSPIVEGKSFGGGINEGFTPVTSGSGGGGGFGGGTRGGGGGFGTTSQLGFTVNRRSVPIRVRLRPQFASPIVTSSQLISRFNQNFYSQPSTVNLNGNFQVTIANDTATVQGSVATMQDANRIIDQLRLQPGVYRIENQLSIGQ